MSESEKTEWVNTSDTSQYLDVSILTCRRWASRIAAGERVRPRNSRSDLTRVRKRGGGFWEFDEDEVKAVKRSRGTHYY